MNKTQNKIGLVITGGGAGAIGEYLRLGGKSEYLVDARVPYSMEALDEFLGEKPEKYCSVETSKLIASEAWSKVYNLIEYDNGYKKYNIFGVGVTASLAKNNEREGREHKAFVTIYNGYYNVVSYHINFLQKTREQQEDALSRLIVNVLTTIEEYPDLLFNNKTKTTHYEI